MITWFLIVSRAIVLGLRAFVRDFRAFVRDLWAIFLDFFSTSSDQIVAVTWFGLCTIPRRKGSAIAAAFGIAGVVIVFVGILSIAQGFRRAVTSTGRDDIAIVLRDGANNEMSSGLSRDDARVIKMLPGWRGRTTVPSRPPNCS